MTVCTRWVESFGDLAWSVSEPYALGIRTFHDRRYWTSAAHVLVHTDRANVPDGIRLNLRAGVLVTSAVWVRLLIHRSVAARATER